MSQELINLHLTLLSSTNKVKPHLLANKWWAMSDYMAIKKRVRIRFVRFAPVQRSAYTNLTPDNTRILSMRKGIYDS